MFTLGVITGAIGASIVWWIEVRGLNRVISDLKDVKADATKVIDQAKNA